MKVICISKKIHNNEYTYKNLVIGKVYNAENSISYGHYKISDKNGITAQHFHHSLFITLEEHRDKQLNKILI